ncbi:Alcohol dehydrogenase [Tolypocladium capitatum]|uniref:Alcohol dehydrogenase n=1 Tax=Tolypocladium capitatum TaxID=45235 RepID=A0A2K3QD57_9HYPO|nr:Alcohol dehydrogenase [Tolypocladium capitatum]
MAVTPSHLPPTQTVLVALSEGKYTIAPRHALPKQPPAPRDITVRVSHVALNPCNWKMIDFSPAIGTVGGNDFSGEVVAIGAEVQRWRIGDAVCGFLYGLDPHAGEDGWAGAFAQYVSVDQGLVMRVVPGLGRAEAACLGAGITTAGMALFRSLGLPPIATSQATANGGGKPVKNRPYLLVYGGSTATGTMAIQLARHAGYTPIATCSPSNFDLVTSFGAEKVFDYHSPSCGVSMRAYTRGKLEHVVDCITDSDSVRTCYAALGPRGGKYTALEPPPEHAKGARKDISSDWVMALTIFGKPVDLKGPFGCDAAPGDMEWARSWYVQAEQLCEKGLLRPHPARVANGTWAEVLEGIDELRSGKVRGTKLVYNIQQMQG